MLRCVRIVVAGLDSGISSSDPRVEDIVLRHMRAVDEELAELEQINP